MASNDEYDKLEIRYSLLEEERNELRDKLSTARLKVAELQDIISGMSDDMGMLEAIISQLKEHG